MVFTRKAWRHLSGCIIPASSSRIPIVSASKRKVGNLLRRRSELSRCHLPPWERRFSSTEVIPGVFLGPNVSSPHHLEIQHPCRSNSNARTFEFREADFWWSSRKLHLWRVVNVARITPLFLPQAAEKDFLHILISFPTMCPEFLAEKDAWDRLTEIKESNRRLIFSD